MQALLQLLASLMAPEVNIDTVCAAITSDARLTYKNIKTRQRKPAKSVGQIWLHSAGSVTTGPQRNPQLATLLLLTSNGTEPQEIYTQSCARAKLCELIGQQIGDKTFAENCFTLWPFIHLGYLPENAH